MITIGFTEIRGHILVPIAYGQALIDTGSPGSCAPKPFHFAGREYAPPSTMACFSPERLGELAGMRIDALIGCDILSALTARFRWHDRKIDIGEDVPDFPFHESFTPFYGTPVFSVGLGGREARALFDTGAHLSYIDLALVAGVEATGEKADFHPLGGHYVAPTYMVGTTLGGSVHDLEYGVLSGTVARMTAMAMADSGTSAIIGTGLFEHFDCTVSWERGTVSWEPNHP
jgi:hypothetical protein